MWSNDPSSPTASQNHPIETESQSSRSVQRMVRCIREIIHDAWNAIVSCPPTW